MKYSTRRRRLIAIVIAICGTTALSACSGATPASSDNAEETRTVDHALGVAEVPSSPDRVVTIDQGLSLATALLVETPVVGTVTPPTGDKFPPFLENSSTAELADVGWFTDLNVEAVASLNPDLIIGSDQTTQPSYDKLTKIAPTVAIERDTVNWKENVLKVAEALGKSDQIEAELAAYDAHAAEIQQNLAAAGVADEPVTLLNIRSAEDIRVYTKSCAAGVLKDVGLEVKLDDITEEGSQFVQLSIERLTQADASTVFYFVGSTGTNPRDAEAAFEQVRSQPLWGQLTAVQDGSAHSVNPAWWFACGSVQAANRILDDVPRLMLGQ